MLILANDLVFSRFLMDAVSEKNENISLIKEEFIKNSDDFVPLSKAGNVSYKKTIICDESLSNDVNISIIFFSNVFDKRSLVSIHGIIKEF